MSFYQNFVSLCVMSGKTPSKVAEEIGISKSIVSRWKRGGGVSDSTAARIAEYFGVSPSELMNDLKAPLEVVAEDCGMDNLCRALKESKQKESPPSKDSGWPSRYNELTASQKKLVDNLIEELLRE